LEKRKRVCGSVGELTVGRFTGNELGEVIPKIGAQIWAEIFAFASRPGK
jgi:hypothetical protein